MTAEQKPEHVHRWNIGRVRPSGRPVTRLCMECGQQEDIEEHDDQH